MASWERSRLGELVETQKGYAFKSVWYCGEGRPIVKVSDFTMDSVDSTALVCIPEETAVSYLRYALQTGDVVVQTVGSWPTNPASVVGKCVRVPNEVAGALLNQNAVKLTPASGFDRTFLFYLLRNEDFKTYIIGTAQGAASQAAITLEAIRGYEFDLPPLSIQQRIAGILSAYDELIENSQRRIKILEAMARALYREWFVHFRPPGHESVPRVPSPLGDIPQGWEVKKLGDLCNLAKDAYLDAKHSELPLLDLARMPSRTLAPHETGKPSELTTSRIVFQPGDTLFGAIRCYLHKVVAMHYSGVTNTSVLVLRPKKASFRSLLAVIASDADTIRWAETQSTGTKMPVINWGVFQKMPTPIPSQALAQEYEKLAGPMLDEIGALATTIQNLRRTRDLLLPRLLSGQIDVGAIP